MRTIALYNQEGSGFPFDWVLPLWYISSVISNLSSYVHLTRPRGTYMEATLNIQGLRKERVEHLKYLVELWKKQDQPEQQAEEDDVKPSDFIVKHSNVKDGRVTRAMAYE